MVSKRPIPFPSKIKKSKDSVKKSSQNKHHYNFILEELVEFS